NTFAFRPHSHFLYFFGWGVPGAAALFDHGRVTVYAPEPDADDALWSGPQRSLADLQASLGVPVAPLAALPATLDRRSAATLPAPDAPSREQQTALLDRPILPGRFSDADAALADAVIALRLHHDDAAVAELREAAAITALAHQAGMRATRAGVRESVVRAAMEAELIAQGCGTAYGSIVTVHGEILHNETHTNVLAEGDLLLADVGAETPGGWAGDVTRTWPVSARYSPEQADIYNVVLAAQRAAIEAVRPGVRYRDLHLKATETIARGLVDLGILRGDPNERAHDGCTALFFPHGVGHLLGLDVHDMEDLGDRAGYGPGRARATTPGLRYLRLDRDLAAGMAVTIEPGIYFVPAMLDDAGTRKALSDRVNWSRVDQVRGLRGIRIEDDVLVTATGADVLTAAIPKRIDEIETITASRPR
ncbi:MAG TPA: aminopeptidase P family protein, partial [Polyangia bacterium]|nr:aminopeptidase P family protein [Polyangia bacterium]